MRAGPTGGRAMTVRAMKGADMRPDPDRIAGALQRLLDGAPAAGLTEQDVDALHRIIAAYRGWQILGRATKWLIAVLVTLAVAAVAWDTLASHLRGWWQP